MLLVVMAIYDQIMLRKNKDLYKTPLGQMAEVDGHNMSICTKGKGYCVISSRSIRRVSPLFPSSDRAA